MHLRNPFPIEVRVLYLYSYECWKCGRNQNLELHHILGRVSSSAFNSAPLCHNCHEHILHTKEERRFLFEKTVAFLVKEGYEPTKEDWDFIRNNYNDIF